MRLSKRLSEFFPPPDPTRALHRPSRAEQMVESFEFTDQVEPPESASSIDEMVAALATVDSVEAFEALPRKVRGTAASMLLSERVRLELGDEHVRSLVAQMLGPQAKMRFVRRFFMQYLRTFSRDDPLTQGVASMLRSHLPAMLPKERARIKALRLLDPACTAALVAAALCDADDYLAFFKAQRLSEPRSQQGIAHATFQALLDRYFSGKTKLDDAGVSRLEAWIRIDLETNLSAGDAKLFAALMSPWLVRGGRGSDGLKRRVERLVLDVFGAPFADRAAHWNAIERGHLDAYQLLMRWLTGESITLFFQIVDETADVNHWEVRKAFWQAYFDEEHILEAFALLGSEATNAADKLYRKTDEPMFKHHGRTPTGNTGQCMLLLKLPGLVIAEGSHSMSTRFFLPGNRPPALYKVGDAYTRDELAEQADERRNHTTSRDRFQWCETHSQLIHKMSRGGVPDLWPTIERRVRREVGEG